MTRLVDDRAQMTLSEVGRRTDAVTDPERAAVKESGAAGEPLAPGAPAGFPDGAGRDEEPYEAADTDDRDGEAGPDGLPPPHRRSGA